MTKLVIYHIPKGIIMNVETDAIPRKGDAIFIDSTMYLSIQANSW